MKNDEHPVFYGFFCGALLALIFIVFHINHRVRKLELQIQENQTFVTELPC